MNKNEIKRIIMTKRTECMLFGVVWGVIAAMMITSLVFNLGSGVEFNFVGGSIVAVVSVFVGVVAYRFNAMSGFIEDMKSGMGFLDNALLVYSYKVDWEDMSKRLGNFEEELGIRRVSDKLLSDSQVALRNEEESLRYRLIDLCGLMAEGVDDELLRMQAVAMIEYHAVLYGRCLDEGVYRSE